MKVEVDNNLIIIVLLKIYIVKEFGEIVKKKWIIGWSLMRKDEFVKVIMNDVCKVVWRKVSKEVNGVSVVKLVKKIFFVKVFLVKIFVVKLVVFGKLKLVRMKLGVVKLMILCVLICVMLD